MEMASNAQGFADKFNASMQLLKRASAALQNGVRTLSPNCREVSRLQAEAIENPLAFRKRLGLRLHLLICAWCRRYGKQVRFLHQAVHDHPEERREPRGLSAETRERLKRRLQNDPK
jgi:hypothetical protein